MAKDILRTLIVSATSDFVKQLNSKDFLNDMNEEFIYSHPDTVSVDCIVDFIDDYLNDMDFIHEISLNIANSIYGNYRFEFEE